ncbi:glycosyl hydrolase 53 family protein [Demequina sp. NBRC 110056]|uniref:glycosyl hydrolase 53 family protein n=1 Tax=Demequina sp. NBRC 110056 TaxID=1570345 RepID=UPI0013565FDE|nr:glycosyl hydrolase 53 family protein [Demequina sp. NBRC 110056]
MSAIAACSSDPAVPEDAAVVVEAVDGLDEDFQLGADVSSVLSLEASGVVFRDATGEPGDLFEILAGAGVTDVRVRVWNDPYDSAGEGYGGGTVDPERAVEIGRRATDAGMGVLVDLHYSDFWADPAKQQAPKGWEELSDEDRAAAAGDFTRETLTAYADANVDVVGVQVGNETNNGVAGVTAWPSMAAIFSAGASAVREVLPDAYVAVHFTDPQRAEEYERYAQILDNYEVDYDVFASSYYPFWHGSLENLTTVLTGIATTYDKQVMVAETSWAYTLEDLDGSANVIAEPGDATAYPVSAQGQALAFRDVVQAVTEVPDGAGIGVYYWEPAWLPVGPADAVDANTQLWERDGSGWATSYAGEYDPEDAGQFWGGSGWDNQALFAADGTPLDSLWMFTYVSTGADAPLAVLEIASPQVDAQAGAELDMPTQVAVRYNDGSEESVDVTWDTTVIPDGELGTFEVPGETADGDAVLAFVTVRPLNDLVNGSFEDDDLSMWALDSDAATFAVVSDNPQAAVGERVLNFWSDADYALTASQVATGLDAGAYTAQVAVHGEDFGGDGYELALVVTTSEGEWSTPLELNGWQAWFTGSIADAVVGSDGQATVSVVGAMGAEDWGFIDDVALIPEGDA